MEWDVVQEEKHLDIILGILEGVYGVTFQIRSIHHINVLVRDIDESLKRYCQLLGEKVPIREALPDCEESSPAEAPPSAPPTSQ